MLVWGGWRPGFRFACLVGANSLHDGARYDPAADAWRPMADYPGDQVTEVAQTLWMDDRWLVVFTPPGYSSGTTAAPEMALYDPELAEGGVQPDVRESYGAWTGEEFVVLGANDGLNIWRYDSSSDAWKRLRGRRVDRRRRRRRPLSAGGSGHGLDRRGVDRVGRRRGPLRRPDPRRRREVASPALTCVRW